MFMYIVDSKNMNAHFYMHINRIAQRTKNKVKILSSNTMILHRTEDASLQIHILMLQVSSLKLQ